MDFGLNGKSVVVTGAGGGIGRACALAFALEGANITVSDIQIKNAERVALEINAIGGRALAVRHDVSDTDENARLMRAATEAYGTVDVLVNSAGIFQSASIDDLTATDWDRVMDVNLRGVFLCSQAALRHMVPRRSGVIVSLGSVAGQVGGIFAGANYATSKAGVISLTKSLAKYAGPYGVRVNCVNPGQIDTPMTQPWPPDVIAGFLKSIPFGRLGTADEVARVIVFLASDAASFIHGAHIDVNGGMFMD